MTFRRLKGPPPAPVVRGQPRSFMPRVAGFFRATPHDDSLGECLSLAEGHSLSFQRSLLVGRNRGVESPRDVPAEGATQAASVADALGRTAAASAPRVVEALKQGHASEFRAPAPTATRPQRPGPAQWRRPRPRLLHQHPGSLKLAIRVCQPAVEDCCPARV